MAELFNLQTRTVEQVPDEQVRDRVLSGSHDFVAGTQIPFVTPQGQVKLIDSQHGTDVLRAFDAGWNYASAAQVQDARERAAAGRDVVGAAIESVGRGATLGLTDAIAAPFMSEAQERGARLRREENPNISLGGEVAGGLLTAGAGLARAGAGAGNVAARAVGRHLAEGTTRAVVQSATRLGVGSAVEGAAYGGGQGITEAALGDRESAAEAILSGIGMGAVLGLPMAAVGGGGRALYEGGRHAIRSTTGAVGRLFERATGTTMNREAAVAVARDMVARRGVASGVPREAAEELLTEAGRAEAITNVQTIDNAAQTMTALVDRTRAIADDVIPEAMGGVKAEHVRRLTRADNLTDVMTEARRTLYSLRNTAEAVAERPELARSAAARRALAAVDEHINQVEGIIRTGRGTAQEIAGDVHHNLDNLKRRLAHFAAPGNEHTADPVALAFREGYQRLRNHLESEAVYGAAGAAQARVNAAWHRYLGRAGGFRKNFLGENGAGEWGPTYAADPGKVSGFVRGLHDSGNDLRYQNFTELLDAQDNLVTEIQAAYGVKNLPRLQHNLATAELRETLETVKKQVEAVNHLRTWRAAEGGPLPGRAMTVAAGYLVGGPVGGAVAGGAHMAADVLKRPAYHLERLAHAERFIGQHRERLRGAVRAFVDKARSGGRRAAAYGRAGARGARAAAPVVGVEAFDQRVRAVKEMVADPQVATERIAAVTEPLTGPAPQLAQQLALSALRGAQFLASKLPRPVGFANQLQPHLVRPRITSFDRSRWLRYYEAVEDPATVVEALEEGRISREGVEALKAVYPKMYEEVVSTFMEEFASLETQPDYQTRLQIGILLGVPTDATLDPQFIGLMQARYAPDQQGQNPQLGGGEMSDASRKILSDAQRLEARRQ